MSDRRDRARRVVEKSAQVVLMAGLVGAVTGFGVAAFERIVVNGLLLHIEELPLWMVALAPMRDVSTVCSSLSLL